MRFIDADKLVEALPIVTEDKKISLYGAVADFMIMISEMPIVDAVEVVRCKDCKYYYDYGVNRDYCCHRSKDGRQVFDVKFKIDDFCSYGERKEQ